MILRGATGHSQCSDVQSSALFGAARQYSSGGGIRRKDFARHGDVRPMFGLASRGKARPVVIWRYDAKLNHRLITISRKLSVKSKTKLNADNQIQMDGHQASADA